MTDPAAAGPDRVGPGDDDRALARSCARAICDAFGAYNAAFRALTQRARQRFEARDWAAARDDAVARIDLYEVFVGRTVDALGERLGDRLEDRALWVAIKAAYGEEIDVYLDREFTKTFFSSITRRVFATVGVDPAVEFVALDLEPLAHVRQPLSLNVYPLADGPAAACSDLLDDYAFDVPWANRASCEAALVAAIDRHRETNEAEPARLEFMRPVFYRNTRAFLVGRWVGGDDSVAPLIVALRHDPDGVTVDTVITRTDETSTLFGFTRSYFHADLETVHDAVAFLRSFLPRKPLAELFTVLGRARQGKTERYRSFFRHLASSDDSFIPAPGDKGMVMAVFTLPSYDLVFKVIRDRFAYPKTVARRDVIDKYRLVFRHDRAGRLVDAQEFRMLRFPRARFETALLDELLGECADTCRLEGDDLVVAHCYTERRLSPLNLYLREQPAERQAAAVIDYGHAIRDLARSNIFAGDLLLKNFGVTRNGRVIFYDYDELCLVTDCRFRELPTAAHPEDEMRGEAWFYVGDDDVFPEQFSEFLAFDPGHLELFRAHHGELLTASWWRDVQARLVAGEVLEVLPYRAGDEAEVAASLSWNPAP